MIVRKLIVHRIGILCDAARIAILPLVDQPLFQRPTMRGGDLTKQPNGPVLASALCCGLEQAERYSARRTSNKSDRILARPYSCSALAPNGAIAAVAAATLETMVSVRIVSVRESTARNRAKAASKGRPR